MVAPDAGDVRPEVPSARREAPLGGGPSRAVCKSDPMPSAVPAPDPLGLRPHLNAAHARLLAGQVAQEIPDPILHHDLAATWADVRENLLEALAQGRYSPRQVEVIDLPKDRLAVRPLARLHPVDQLLYEALVIALQPDLDRSIPRSVYSSRWSRRRNHLLNPVGSWLRMQSRGRTFHRRHPGLLMAKTDISSFYEHVDVALLTDALRGLLGDRPVVDVLADFLRNFAEQNQVWGLPQGSDASGVLANVYLLPIDLHLRDRGYTYFRYSDDILIFGPDWNTLRQELIRITQLLRGLRLHLASSKTRIVRGGHVLGEFEEADKDAIKYGLDVGLPGANDELRALFDAAVADAGELRSRDVKFSLTQMARLRDDHAVDWLIGHLSAVPHLAREVVRYLTVFLNSDMRVHSAATKLLRTDALLFYPYAEMHLLILLMRDKQGRSAQVSGLVWRLLEDRNRPGFVREYAARFVGMYGRPGDATRLRGLLNAEGDPRLRRALLVAMYECGGVTEEFLRHPMRNVPDLKVAAQYLLTAPTLPQP